MNLAFFVSCLEPGKDGVGDYTRRLAAQFVRLGHQCLVVSLCDGDPPKSSGPPPSSLEQQWRRPESHTEITEYLESQMSEGVGVSCLRLPASLAWPKRLELARLGLEHFRADWVSLQFVPFGFHEKGLPFFMANRLKKVIAQRQLHIMFHELWLGLESKASLKHRAWGGLQRRLILKMIKHLEPSIVETHAAPYRQVLAREKVKVSVLPLFGNIPVAAGNGWDELLGPIISMAMGAPQERDSLYLAGVFGTVHPEWDWESSARSIQVLAQRFQKRLVLVFLGKSHLSSETLVSLKSKLQNGIEVVNAGERPAIEISKILQTLDLGLATSPRQIIEKSGSVAAMLEHGLPVLATRDDWQLRGGGQVDEEIPLRFLSPRLFATLERLPTRNSTLGSESPVNRVALQMLGEMQQQKYALPGQPLV